MFVLHLANGESAARVLKAAGVPGVVVPVDDILVEGPLAGGLASAAAWTARAAWLQRHLGIPKGDYLAHAGRRRRALRLALAQDELVLWSEEDLFCQTNLAHSLFLIAEGKPAARVSLAVPAPPGRTGTASPDALAALFEARQPLSSERLVWGARAWSAFASSDPRDVERLRAADLAAWPALRDGLALHLARFPSTRDGLGAPERALLQMLSAEPLAFGALLRAFHADARCADYGFGDVSVLARLRTMTQGARPLVFVDDPRALEDAASEGRWALTDLARDILAGRTDAVAARGIDTWVGGVELNGATTPWRWDEARERLVPT